MNGRARRSENECTKRSDLAAGVEGMAGRIRAVPRCGVREYVWQNPQCTENGVRELMSETKDAEVLIAIGSGTLNDSVKYGSFLTGRQYSVFPTSPMKAYTLQTG